MFPEVVEPDDPLEKYLEERLNAKRNFVPMQEYLETLPGPQTFREKMLCWLSNIIDELAVLRWKIKMWRKHDKNIL